MAAGVQPVDSLRRLHRNVPSSSLLLCSASLILGGAAFMLDVLLQVEEHVHVSLLCVVESRCDLHAALVWEARKRASGLSPLPLVEPQGNSTCRLSWIHWTAVSEQWQLTWIRSLR